MSEIFKDIRKLSSDIQIEWVISLSSPSAMTIDSRFSGYLLSFDWNFKGFFISLRIVDFTFLLQNWLNVIT